MIKLVTYGEGRLNVLSERSYPSRAQAAKILRTIKTSKIVRNHLTRIYTVYVGK